MKKVGKILAIILSAIILSVVVLCLLLASGVLNGIILSQGLKQAKQFLNAELKVEELSCNPFTHLELKNAYLIQENEEVLRVKKVELSYDLLALLDREIDVEKVIIDDLSVKVWQDKDSVWSFMKVVKLTDNPAEPDTASMNWALNLQSIECAGFSATVEPLDTTLLIPQTIQAGFELSLRMDSGQLKISLDELTLKTLEPAFEVQSLAFNFVKDSNSINWNNLCLKLPHSEILSEGKYFLNQPLLSACKISVDTLAFESIRQFMPQFKLFGNPSVLLVAQGDGERINFSALAQQNLQSGEIRGWISQLTAIPEYHLTLDVANLDASGWLDNTSLSTQITGTIEAEGRGYDLQKSTVKATGNFAELSYQNYALKNLSFEAQKDSSVISGNLETETWFGNLAGRFRVADFLSRFRYTVDCTGTRIDLSKLSLPGSMNSSLNLHLEASGEGINPLKGSVKANVSSSESSINNLKIDDIRASLSYKNGRYDVPELSLLTPYFNLNANGSGDIKNDNNLRFNFETKAFNDLLSAFGLPEYSLECKIDGELSGNMSHYSANASFDLGCLKKD